MERQQPVERRRELERQRQEEEQEEEQQEEEQRQDEQEEEQEKNQLMDRELWHHVGKEAGDDITGGGWLSSYTGRPIPREEMDEYGDNVLIVKHDDHELNGPPPDGDRRQGELF